MTVIICRFQFLHSRKSEVDIYGCASAGIGERLYNEPISKEFVRGYVPAHDIALK